MNLDWPQPNAIGYVKIYFQSRNARHPLYRRTNRALCRYWIRQARRQQEAHRARFIARLNARQLADAWRDKVITPAEYSAAMTALAVKRGLSVPEVA